MAGLAKFGMSGGMDAAQLMWQLSVAAKVIRSLGHRLHGLGPPRDPIRVRLDLVQRLDCASPPCGCRRAVVLGHSCRSEHCTVYIQPRGVPSQQQVKLLLGRFLARLSLQNPLRSGQQQHACSPVQHTIGVKPRRMHGCSYLQCSHLYSCSLVYLPQTGVRFAAIQAGIWVLVVLDRGGSASLRSCSCFHVQRQHSTFSARFLCCTWAAWSNVGTACRPTVL